MVKYLYRLFISEFRNKYSCLNVVSRIMDVNLCINVLETFIFLLKNVTMKFDIYVSVHHYTVYENDQQDATV
jgi:hypothetical protein